MMKSGRLRRGRITASMCAFREDGRPGARRGDHDVARAEHRVHLLPRRRACAADRLRGARRVRHRPADDRHLLHALRLHVPGRQLAHFAGADDEDGPALEVAEDLARERDGRKADRDGARSRARFPCGRACRRRTTSETGG